VKLRVPFTATNKKRQPLYSTPFSSGADLTADIESPLTLRPGERAIIPTGIRLAIPAGYEAQVRPRSGLALKHGVTVLNSPGTIDSDYRGEVKIILINLGSGPYTITQGSRIAQLVFAQVINAEFLEQETLPSSERNEGGFGSTGTH
jgi:dUTP pyrophosphatase